jgi:DNA-binding IclR family transcriptional regulator
LHKALDILETIGEGRSGFALTDLARALDLPKPTAYRIVATMETRGYIARNKNGHYQMTRKLSDLWQNESEEDLLLRAAKPVMQQLVESCRETVNLGVLDAAEVVVVSMVESPQSIRMISKVGNRRYLHSTALGKVLLSGLPEKEVDRLIRIQGLPRLTPRTLVSRQSLAKELARVLKQGYALDNEENELDGRCLGAGIVNQSGRIAAALSISAPTFRMDMARVKSLAGELRDACRDISSAMAPQA